MDLVVGDVFANAARAAPGMTAVVLGNRVLTFSQVDERADAVTARAQSLGLKRGARVAGLFGTDPDAVPLFAGLARAGLVFSPINPLLSPEEATAVLQSLCPELIVHDADRATAATALASRLDVPVARLADLAAAGDASSDDAVRPTEQDPHVVFFTSGSSGRPKGVVLSHRVSVLRSHPGAQLEPRGPAVCAFPLFHMAAWTIGLQQWHARAGLVLVGRADAPQLLQAITDNRAERINCVPAVWRRILDALKDAGDDGRYDLSTLRFADTGTSATPPDLLAAIARALPTAVVRVFYGSTEAGSVASMAGSELAAKPGRCGVPSPLAEVRVHEKELQVRGPLVFDEYDDPVTTAAAFEDDWYRTGDRAEVDDDGYISIVGRIDDVIRTGGESVSPAEVEVVLATHPAIADCAVIGLPSAEWGEIVCAVVVPAGDTPPTVAELQDHCIGSLARFKQPRRVEPVPEIPRTEATGKVQRLLLLDQIIGAP